MTITRRPLQTPGTLPPIKVQPSRSPSLRSRKSPIVGPSPLRIVTLPEGSLANLNKEIDKDLLPSIPSLSSSTGSVTAPTSHAGEWSKHQNYSAIFNGLLAIRNNIQENHNGFLKGPWNLAVKSFRSTLSQTPGIHLPLEPPTRADVVQAIADKTTPPNFHPTHYRTTFLTLNPPGALEQLLAQLKARWVPVRQTSTNNAQRGQASPIKRRGDWTGVDRDRRSAFLAIGDLKSEGIL
ncbi:uncharacterized protein C8R40DRAFT_1165147 [Lentinula edodes]|uniref:uncharacterized protein n=1 Tax=Lentinula edodes TaxID=5353 RepID=UPI001E8DAA02|nr:uncharacterized protein C8R40DRAFT_1165147 [Lentinula edodes]KAH7880242.1 hypothetical protein C8R40DRAFT_1165147 [Lentinula edodes]